KTIAPHLRGHRTAALIKDRQLKGFTIFVTQLENMPNLNATHNLECRFSIGSGIARSHISKINEARLLGITLPVKAGVVIAIFICADNQVGCIFYGIISVNLKAMITDRA